MSERYAIQYHAELQQQFATVRGTWEFESRYNVALKDAVPVVRITRGKREITTLRWGLIPYTAKGVAGERPLMMATFEKLESSYPWQLPWKRGQRCILPALGFYKWHRNGEGASEPYFIHLKEYEVFGIAGIWDRSLTVDGTTIESCALITIPANKLVYGIHNTGQTPHRMPAILRREDYQAWLSGRTRQAKRCLLQYPAELMDAHRVSPRVNSLENDDAELIESISGTLPERIEDLKVTWFSPEGIGERPLLSRL